MSSTSALLLRDRAILEHLARYRVTLLEVVSRLFFEGRDPGRVLGMLAKRTADRPALIKMHSRALRNNLTYVTLTPAGFVAAGIPLRRRAGEPLGQAALSKAISLVAFSCLGSHRRHRLQREELTRAFGSAAPPDNVFHVASDEVGYPTIFRVVFASSVDERQLTRLQKHVQEARQNVSIRPWVEAGDYGFAILVPWPGKTAAMRELVARSSLGKEVVTITDLGPTDETLREVLQRA